MAAADAHPTLRAFFFCHLAHGRKSLAGGAETTIRHSAAARRDGSLEEQAINQLLRRLAGSGK